MEPIFGPRLLEGSDTTAQLHCCVPRIVKSFCQSPALLELAQLAAVAVAKVLGSRRFGVASAPNRN